MLDFRAERSVSVDRAGHGRDGDAWLLKLTRTYTSSFWTARMMSGCAAAGNPLMAPHPRVPTLRPSPGEFR